MRSAVAVLTWNRIQGLANLLGSLNKLGSPLPFRLAVFEDSGYSDQTSRLLSGQGEFQYDRRYQAQRTHKPSEGEIFLGSTNLGVAGNSNRALRWFMEESEADHLVLLNDDVAATGDFTATYREAHLKTGVGLFCFCRLPDIAVTRLPVNGLNLLAHERMTGVGLSLTRALVERIGYFDLRFGKFGEEHCDYTNRARLAGQLRALNNDWLVLDVEHDQLQHQEIPPCLPSAERAKRLELAESRARQTSYSSVGLWRPCLLKYRPVAGIGHAGINVDLLDGYTWAD